MLKYLFNKLISLPIELSPQLNLQTKSPKNSEIKYSRHQSIETSRRMSETGYELCN
jgi:hypothetical protein